MKQLSQNLLKIRNDKTGEYEVMPAVGGDKASSILYKNTNNVLDGENVQDVLDDVSSKIGRTLTKAEYDALSQYEKENGTYFIKDIDHMTGASGITYDNKASNLHAENVQEAIDEVVETMDTLSEQAGKSEINDNGVSTDKTWSSSKIQKTIEGIVVSGGGEGTGSALTTAYDNSTSGLNAGSVQGAIDELDTRVDQVNEDILPLKGTAALTNNLYIENNGLYFQQDGVNKGEVRGNVNYTRIIHHGDSVHDNTQLQVINANDISDAIRLERYRNSSSIGHYKLYGEHNKPTAEDTGALPLAGGEMSGWINFNIEGKPYGIRPQHDGNFAIWNGNKALCFMPDGNGAYKFWIHDAEANTQYAIYSQLNKPTTEEINAMSWKKAEDINTKSTILDVVNSMNTSGSFTVNNGIALCTAADSPYSGVEFHYLVLMDQYGRKRIIAFDFGNGKVDMFVRRVFNNAWIENSWNRMYDTYFEKTGGTVTGNTTFNGECLFSGGVSGIEGGQVSFARPESNSNFGSNIIVDVYANAFRWFADHDNILKTIELNFGYGAGTIYHTGMMAASTTPITAGSTVLANSCYYDVLE